MKLGSKLMGSSMLVIIGMIIFILLIVNNKITKHERQRIITDLSTSAENFEIVLTNKEHELSVQLSTFFQDPLRLAEIESQQSSKGLYYVMAPYLDDIGYADKNNFAALYHEAVENDVLSLNLLYPPPDGKKLQPEFPDLREFLNKKEVLDRLPIDKVLTDGAVIEGQTLMLDNALYRISAIPVQAAFAGENSVDTVFILFRRINDAFARDFMLKGTHALNGHLNAIISVKNIPIKESENNVTQAVFLIKNQLKPLAMSMADLNKTDEIVAFFQQEVNHANSIGVGELSIMSERYLALWRVWSNADPQGGYVLLKNYGHALKSFSELQVSLLVLGGCVAMIAVFVSFRLTHSIVRPIASLVNATRVMEEGNLQVAVPVISKDEIGELTESFNHMVILVREKEETEAILAQKEIERHRAISEMVTGVAHEINTPLGIVNSAADIISTIVASPMLEELQKSDDDIRETFGDLIDASQLIQNNVTKAGQLVQRFKSVSVDQLTDSLEQVDLGEKLDEYVFMYQMADRVSRLQINIECTLDIEERQWLGYPGFLFQVVQNLLANIERYAYSDGEEAKVEIGLRIIDSAFELTVTDFGKGMDEKACTRIFDAFFTTGRSIGGSGLGMAIVHNIVTSALKGRINVESELAKGTTMRVTFPREIEER